MGASNPPKTVSKIWTAWRSQFWTLRCRGAQLLAVRQRTEKGATLPLLAPSCARSAPTSPRARPVGPRTKCAWQFHVWDRLGPVFSRPCLRFVAKAGAKSGPDLGTARRSRNWYRLAPAYRIPLRTRPTVPFWGPPGGPKFSPVFRPPFFGFRATLAHVAAIAWRR